jgi:hemoglobin
MKKLIALSGILAIGLFALTSGGCKCCKPDAGEDAAPAAAEKATLFERVGGQPAIDATVDAFYVKVLADDRVNDFFTDVSMKRQHTKQKSFIAAALGGPVPYEGKNMRQAHASLDVTEDDFNVIAGHLQSTLQDLKVEEGLIGEIMAVVGSVKSDVLGTKK